jgi:hypothetical protein
VIAPIGAAAVVAAGIWFFVANNHKTNESNPNPASAAIPAKSIAVLPFENISPNKDDAYFADKDAGRCVLWLFEVRPLLGSATKGPAL